MSEVGGVGCGIVDTMKDRNQRQDIALKEGSFTKNDKFEIFFKVTI